MWVEDEDLAESDGESDFSFEDDIQYEILELQRDEATLRLADLEEVSNQLLKEMNMLEIQFQIERSCRESAEELAVQVTRENKTLKRRSQMLMPLIPELPENLPDVTFDLETGPTVNGCDVVDFGESGSEETPLLLQSQATIAELQASVDGLLAEKMQLQQQVETLTSEQVQLRQRLALEAEEKEIILRKLSKQSRTMSKIKGAFQLVSEEFTEMSQKLELEQGLRQHAEVLAHQMMAQPTAADLTKVTATQSSEVQLQRALEQVANISTALVDIHHYYQDKVTPSQSSVGDGGVPGELQSLREELERSEEERKALESQLSEATGAATQLQDEVKQLQDALKREEKTDELEENIPAAPPPAPPPPPPLPPLPPPAVTNPLDFLRKRRKDRADKGDQNKPDQDVKARAVDEMMERIKKGIVLRPTNRIQDDDSSWTDQKSENRKSAVVELKGMLDNMKHRNLCRVPSRRRTGRHVGEAELLQVLQRRRRAMGETQDLPSSSPTQDPQLCPASVPAAADDPWAGEPGGATVLRRLRQNREKRDSRIRASALVISQQT